MLIDVCRFLGSTPYAYDRKTPNFAQDLDFLRYLKARAKENRGTNQGKHRKSRVLFLNMFLSTNFRCNKKLQKLITYAAEDFNHALDTKGGQWTLF